MPLPYMGGGGITRMVHVAAQLWKAVTIDYCIGM